MSERTQAPRMVWHEIRRDDLHPARDAMVRRRIEQEEEFRERTDRLRIQEQEQEDLEKEVEEEEAAAEAAAFAAFTAERDEQSARETTAAAIIPRVKTTA